MRNRATSGSRCNTSVGVRHGSDRRAVHFNPIRVKHEGVLLGTVGASQPRADHKIVAAAVCIDRCHESAAGSGHPWSGLPGSQRRRNGARSGRGCRRPRISPVCWHRRPGCCSWRCRWHQPVSESVRRECNWDLSVPAHWGVPAPGHLGLRLPAVTSDWTTSRWASFFLNMPTLPCQAVIRRHLDHFIDGLVFQNLVDGLVAQELLDKRSDQRYARSHPARNTAARDQCPNDPDDARQNDRAMGLSCERMLTFCLPWRASMPCRHISGAQTSSSGQSNRSVAVAGWLEPPIGPAGDRQSCFARSSAATVAATTISDLAQCPRSPLSHRQMRRRFQDRDQRRGQPPWRPDPNRPSSVTAQ